MKVFVAGASGALDRRLVPVLVSAGHEVVGMTRSPEGAGVVRELDAEPVVADGLDKAAVIQAVTSAEPEVVIHEMTGLTDAKSFRKFDDEFALTNRLRTEGLDHLLDAARAVALGVSSLRASATGTTSASEARRRPKTTRSTRTRPPA